MLKHSAAYYVAVGQLFERVAHDYSLDLIVNNLKREINAQPPGTQIKVQYADKSSPEKMRESLRAIATSSAGLPVPVFSKILDQLIDSSNPSARDIENLLNVLHAELEALVYLFIPPHLARYYECDDLVSAEATAAFPSAAAEMRSAGSCLASGMNTASVFHSMRAAELGLKALAKDLNLEFNKPIEQSGWMPLLNGIAGKIRDIENQKVSERPTKEADLAFYSEAAAQFRFFKNAWRIAVMHARATFDEPQAKEIIDHVCSLFETLSERLSE